MRRHLAALFSRSNWSKSIRTFLLLAFLAPALVSCHLADSRGGQAALPLNPVTGDVFTYKDELIHPGCLWLLESSIADTLPCVAAVDIVGCQKAERFYRPPSVEDGWVVWKDENEFGTGSYEYMHLGMLRNGIHVIFTQWNGGGSGMFRGLLFIRVKETKVIENSGVRDQMLLICVGQYGLGDRDTGTVTLDGNKVLIGPSQYRDMETTLDLGSF